MTITRDMLDPDLSALISDEAIEVANDPRLIQARQLWDDDRDFVDQVDYQLDFRELFDYLSDEPGHLNVVLSEKPTNIGITELRLYLTDGEAAEFERRLSVGDIMPRIAAVVTGVTEDTLPEGENQGDGGNFGGIWMDQLDGGKIVLAVADASIVDFEAISKLIPLDQLKVIDGSPTLTEIEQARSEIREALTRAGIKAGFTVESTGSGRILQVVVENPNSVSSDIVPSLNLPYVVLEQGQPGFLETGSPASLHSFADQQPGLGGGFGTPQGANWCTWGHNGHTSVNFYIVTAAHCLKGYENHFGSVTGAYVYQANNSSRNVAASSPYIGSRYSQSGSTYWDHARVEGSYSDDNCYHSSSGHCYWYMTNRASGDHSWEINSDTTCASLGKSDTYRCGLIREEDLEGFDGLTRADIDVQSGDSGAGMKYSSYIDGIAVSIHNPTGDLAFLSAYRVTINMGASSFSFNCHSGRRYGGSPGDWSVCPTINR